MTKIDLTVHKDRRARAIQRAKERNIIIPTYAQMKDPSKIPAKIKDELKILRIRMDEAIKNKDVLLQKRLLKEYDDLMKQKKPEEGRPYEK